MLYKNQKCCFFFFDNARYDWRVAQFSYVVKTGCTITKKLTSRFLRDFAYVAYFFRIIRS